MTELSKADVEALQRLGKTLRSEAESIRGIECVPLPIMPGSPIESASRCSDREVRLSYDYMATTIDALGEGITSAAQTYEAVDNVIAYRLKAYQSGK